MKNTWMLLALIFIFTGCKNTSENNDREANTRIIDSSQNEKPSNTGLEKTTSVTEILAGTYIRKDSASAGTDCNCNCVEIDFKTTTPLCLDLESNLSILARYEKTSDSTLQVYYAKPLKKENSDQEKIPWDQFDTGTPIATINSTEDDAFEMDWKGFSIDGEIAIEYAIYGKKNLEGLYVEKQ